MAKTKKEKIRPFTIEDVKLSFICPATEKEVKVSPDELPNCFFAYVSPCELCGSHGEKGLEFNCPLCGKFHEITLLDW